MLRPEEFVGVLVVSVLEEGEGPSVDRGVRGSKGCSCVLFCRNAGWPKLRRSNGIAVVFWGVRLHVVLGELLETRCSLEGRNQVGGLLSSRRGA